MKRSFFAVLLMLLSLLVWTTTTVQAESAEKPVRAPGVIDLSDWDGIGTWSLDGQWELYWNELLTPEQFQAGAPARAAMVRVPSKWSDNSVGGAALPNQGYATYRLKLTLSNQAAERPLALYVRGIATAYRMWVNGRLITENGVVGTSREAMVPFNLPKAVAFQPQAGANEIIIQVSNFVQRKGGIWEPIQVGEVEAILRERFLHLFSETFIIGSLIVMGIYHLSLYAFRRKDKSPLFFGGLCLSVAARTLVTGEATVLFLFPNIPWEAAVKVEYISVFAGLLMLVLFVQNEYGGSISPLMEKLSYAVQSSCTLLVLVTPALVYTQMMLTYQLLVVMPVLFYALGMYLRAFVKRRRGSAINMTGFIVFGAAATSDILFYNQVVSYGAFIPYGLLGFLFTQSVNLSSKFARTSRQAEGLSLQLATINESLGRAVSERTFDLQVMNRNLEQANEELSRMASFRQRLLSDISHELGTPITSIKGISRAILDGMIQGDHLEYVSRIYDRIGLMERLIEDLTELAKLETRQIRFDYHEVEAVTFFRELFQIYALDSEDYEMAFDCTEEIQTAEREGGRLLVKVDPIRIEQVMVNLLSNARKYTPSGGHIRVVLGLQPASKAENEETRSLAVSVEDTGPGIPEAEVGRVFERFYRMKGSPSLKSAAAKGSGLGLAICKEIVDYHGGMIGLESKPGAGSRFYFTLPMQ